jgi:hypothetical protein
VYVTDTFLVTLLLRRRVEGVRDFDWDQGVLYDVQLAHTEMVSAAPAVTPKLDIIQHLRSVTPGISGIQQLPGMEDKSSESPSLCLLGVLTWPCSLSKS